MTASVPQVASPATRKATIGKVPAVLRCALAGPDPGPVHWSSMPPVPKVALASPGKVAPWPTSEACWSPAMPQMGGAPGSAVAAPRAPEESTIVGSMAAGIRSLARSSRSQPIVRGSTSAVTPAFVASVTCKVSDPLPPPLSVHATHESTVPKQSSPASARVRCGSTSSRIAITFVADALGAR